METESENPECELHRLILEFGNHIAGSSQITAGSVFDFCASETTSARNAIEAIFIVRDFPSRIRSFLRVISGHTVVIIAVDQWVFERDIERGFLGEASVGTLVFPYTALRGKRYLHTQEVALKKRLILELLENLRLSFPEFSDRIRIKPEYFMYEVLVNRVRVFPPLGQCTSTFMRISERESKPSQTLKGYIEALEQLEKERKIRMSEGYIMAPRAALSDTQKSRIWLTNLSRMAPRTLFTPIFEMFPQMLNLFGQNLEAFQKLQTFKGWKKRQDNSRAFVDPQKYVFVPTSHGLVSLADRVSVESFVRDMVLHGEKGKVRVEGVGGVLNDVYLVRIEMPDGEKRLLVKRFKDWSGFKWFPLNLWSLGSTKFAVLGKTRLEKECVMSEILRDKGFNVPKILHVGHGDRLVFMEYINGENLADQIKKLASAKASKPEGKKLDTITRTGELIAKVHALGLSLGDTKPENVIIDPAGEIYLLDFEQASREGGDKAWDVAEFLYFSGHYLPPLHSEEKAEAIARAFVEGYLRGGGDLNVVNSAAKVKYTRVFSLFAAPAVIAAMAQVCQKARVLKDNADKGYDAES